VASPIAKDLLKWYAARRRDLPWRQHPEPYAVWVAEIMAQQTRLESMLPYYQRWMQRFPDLSSLAVATEQEVLSLWEGLGYYSRARNLHHAAQVVLREYGGQLPSTVEKLRRLPGIGAYTAGAIASVAFGRDETAVDGNALRVLARVFDVDLVVGSQAATRRFWELARQHLPAGKAAEYNQALMDLGAHMCTPRNPTCDVCPLKQYCLARELGIQQQRPMRARKKTLPQRCYSAAVIEREDKLLLLRRPPGGLLGGMWEFPSVLLEDGQKPKPALRRSLRDMGLAVNPQAHLADLQHTYSHFRADLCVFRCELKDGDLNGNREYQWVSLPALADYPMGKLDRQIASLLMNAVG
jgi:A/G-specific adenine glycosylase